MLLNIDYPSEIPKSMPFNGWIPRAHSHTRCRMKERVSEIERVGERARVRDSLVWWASCAPLCSRVPTVPDLLNDTFRFVLFR